MNATNRQKNIFLIGPLGAGKSTIGRAMARLLKKNFYDTDRLIEEFSGVSISWIIDIEGEQYECGPGSLIVFPAGVRHRNWNGGSCLLDTDKQRFPHGRDVSA